MIVNPHMNPTEVEVKNNLVYVQVTEEDIQNGRAKSPIKCPIGLALNRSIGCLVGDLQAFWFSNEESRITHRAYLPRVARDFIARFDRQESVIPISFILKFKPL